MLRMTNSVGAAVWLPSAWFSFRRKKTEFTCNFTYLKLMKQHLLELHNRKETANQTLIQRHVIMLKNIVADNWLDRINEIK